MQVKKPASAFLRQEIYGLLKRGKPQRKAKSTYEGRIRMSNRLKIVMSVLLLSLFLLSGCSDLGNSPVETTDETVRTTETTKAVTTKVTTAQTTKIETTKQETTTEETTPEVTTQEEEKPFYDELFVMPKDGLRPIAVVIDNEGSTVLPQGGPGLAQVVYEFIVEGGISRIMPIYWGLDIDYLGPVRSARHYMLDYMKEYDAFFVHFGWSPQAKSDISTYGVQIANGVSNAYDIFWDITKNKNNWQDTYTNSSNVEKMMNRNKYSTETKVNMSDRYVDEWIVPDVDATCEQISIRYSSGYRIGYEYNPETGLYDKTRQGQPHMERNNGLQIQAGNIIIMRVKNYTIKGDTEGRQHLETAGSGKGYYITSGKVIEINWSKETRFARTRFTDSNGDEIRLNPARTWVQVVPLDATIELD